MNAVGIAEQESGRALGFFCGKCGRPQLPVHCQNSSTVEQLTELHRRADKCCDSSMCPKHDFMIYGWHHCSKCVEEGSAPEPVAIETSRDLPALLRNQATDLVDAALRVEVAPSRKRTRKAAK